MKKIITLALALAATTLIARAQSAVKNDIQAAPASAVNQNPLYTPKGTAGNNPLAAEVKPVSPLHEANTGSTINPLFEGHDKVSGQPIGGIVVKGGQNGLEITSGNPIPGVGVVVKHNITGDQKTVAQPGVKSDKGIQEKGIK
ncbi:MAG: hypothetical protein V4592_27280 [Bacteroidota bacterium]